jgi:hypothetical protein
MNVPLLHSKATMLGKEPLKIKRACFEKIYSSKQALIIFFENIIK